MGIAEGWKGKAMRLLMAALAMAGSLAAELSNPELTLRALEAYRRGNCKEAVPLLESLLARQSGNRSVRQLLQSCKAGTAGPAKPATRRAASLNAPPEESQEAQESAEAKERRLAGADFDRAEVLIKQGKVDDAERLLAAVVKRSPDLMLPRLRLAEVYTRKKQSRKAAEMYVEMAGRSHQSIYLLRAAQNYSWDKSYSEAIRYYDRYLEAAPADTNAQLARANLLLWIQDMDGAIDAFTRYLELKPDDVQARSGLAHALLWSDEYAGALEEFERLLKANPADVQFQLGAAQSLERLGKSKEAQARYRAILAAKPGDAAAAEGQERVRLALLQKDGFAEAERGNYDRSAELFEQYLQAKPGDSETVVQLARVKAWGERYTDSAAQYRRYLKIKPNDDDVLREMARVELAVPDFPAAQQHFEQLSTRPKAKKEDLEGLVNSLVWAGKTDAAEPWAKKLAAMDSNNTTALDAMRIIRKNRQNVSREEAQKLTGEGRYPEAIEAYRKHEKEFGRDRESMLAVARIYSWDKQLPRSIAAYQEYLTRYPSDTEVTLELGRVQQYAGDPQAAESAYRAVLARDRSNAGALLGMAQSADQMGEDPFRVVEAYRMALRADKNLKPARDRIEELIPDTTPSAGFQMKHFGDSDGFRRDTYSLEGSMPLRGGLRLTPFYRYTDIQQLRQVGGAACGSDFASGNGAGLSDEICATNGSVHGHAGGLRLGLSPQRWLTVFGEVSQTRFNLNRSRFNAQFDVTVKPGKDSALTLGYTRRDAVYDVNTSASLFGGVMGDSYYAAYAQPLSNKWRLSLGGGLTSYDEGTGFSTATNQRRGSARILYRIGSSANAGYYMRVSSFTRPSPLFFSPRIYGVGGATYDWNKRMTEHVSLLGEAELGFGRLRRFDQAGVNVTEFALYMGVGWRIRPDLNLRLGYRLSRGVSSSFGSPVYRTGGFDFGMTDYFAPSMQTTNPSRIDIH